MLWITRGDARRIIPMRYANEHEICRYNKRLKRGQICLLRVGKINLSLFVFVVAPHGVDQKIEA